MKKAFPNPIWEGFVLRGYGAWSRTKRSRHAYNSNNMRIPFEIVF